jgi:hypothetical protein
VAAAREEAIRVGAVIVSRCIDGASEVSIPHPV